MSNNGIAHLDFLIHVYGLEIAGDSLIFKKGNALAKNTNDLTFIYANRPKIIARLTDIETAKIVAVNTRKRQKIGEYLVNCVDRRYACNADIITHIAMPDGTIKTQRQHTG